MKSGGGFYYTHRCTPAKVLWNPRTSTLPKSTSLRLRRVKNAVVSHNSNRIQEVAPASPPASGEHPRRQKAWFWPSRSSNKANREQRVDKASFGTITERCPVGRRGNSVRRKY